jgi:hypothetical protein
MKEHGERTMSDNRGLDLRAVVERFDASTRALDDLSENLTSLTATSELLRTTNQSTQSAANSISAAVNQIVALNDRLRKATEAVASATESAGRFLSNTDMSQVSKGLEDLRSLFERQIITLAEERDAARSEVQQLRTDLLASQAETESLRRKFDSIPEKNRKKLGI